MEEKKKALFRHKLINQLNNMLLYLCKSSVPYVKFICLVFVSLHYTQLHRAKWETDVTLGSSTVTRLQ